MVHPEQYILPAMVNHEQSPKRAWVSWVLWTLAVIIMLAAADFQERTGPTKEFKGSFTAGGAEYGFELVRSGNTDADAPVTVPDPGNGLRGEVHYKRYPTDDPITVLPMESVAGELQALLPAQPAAGKMEYFVVLESAEGTVRIPEDDSLIIRFKDPVPIWILVPHIIFMFIGLLVGVRTSLGAAVYPVALKRLVWTTLGLMTVGGMILGPIVQKYAFGAFWTGWPFGYDLTDNKTLIMWIVWVGVALILSRRPSPRDWISRGAILVAAVVMMTVYLIPHSLRGSELDYSQLEEVGLADSGIPVLGNAGFGAARPAGLPRGRSHQARYPHQVVRVTPAGFPRPAELSVAINPTDPDNVVVVSLAAGPPGGPGTTNYAYVSKDGGQTWTTVSQPNPDGRTQGDDAVTFDSRGRAYRTYISFDGIRVSRPPLARNGIFVSRSEDGGDSWGAPVPVVDHINTVEPFEDKPWLTADNVPGSPYQGNVYLAWTRFDVYGSDSPNDSTQILFSRSVDGGESFSVPIRISDSGGDALDSDDTVEGAVPAVGPGGEVYVAWAGPKGIVFDRSMDGGWTFGEDRVIAENPGGWDIPLPGMARHNGLPVTVTDVSPGPHGGSVYVNWIDERNGDADVFVLASRDKGESWGDPVRVNDDPLGNGKAQLFTWIAVDPMDGSLNLVFLDRRSTAGDFQAVTLARSTDGGRSFQNFAVDQSDFRCPDSVFYGDYLAIAAFGGRVVAAWPHCSESGELALSAALFSFPPDREPIQPRPDLG
jgi:hypothetical protein